MLMSDVVLFLLIVDFVNGKVFMKDVSGMGCVVVWIVELNGGIFGLMVFFDVSVDDKYVVCLGDIFFVWLGLFMF